MKKVFLDDFKNEKGLIQWENIIGHFIKFIYEEEFEGEYTIREFVDIFSERYGENFTRQGIETSVKRNTLYKNKYKFKLVK